MATPKSSTQATSPTVDVNTAPTFALEDQQRLVSSRPMYSTDMCKGHAIQGYLMGTVLMNPSKANVADAAKSGKPAEMWTALIVRLTEDCPAVDADKQVKMYHKGDEIAVGGVELNDVYAAANDEERVFEAWLKPKDTIPLGGGRKMTRFEKVINMKPLGRAANKMHLFGRTRGLAALPPAGGTGRTADGSTFNVGTGEVVAPPQG